MFAARNKQRVAFFGRCESAVYYCSVDVVRARVQARLTGNTIAAIEARLLPANSRIMHISDILRARLANKFGK